MGTELKKTLNELEVGDVVIQNSSGLLTTTTVAKITKTQITVANGVRFSRARGDEIGGNKHIFAPLDTVYGTTRLEMFFAQRDARKAKREKLIKEIKDTDFDKLSTDDLVYINGLLTSMVS